MLKYIKASRDANHSHIAQQTAKIIELAEVGDYKAAAQVCYDLADGLEQLDNHYSKYITVSAVPTNAWELWDLAAALEDLSNEFNLDGCVEIHGDNYYLTGSVDFFDETTVKWVRSRLEYWKKNGLIESYNIEID